MDKILEQQEKFFDFLGIIHAALAAYKIPESDEVCEVFTTFSNVMESIIAPDLYAQRIQERENIPDCCARLLPDTQQMTQVNSHRPPMPRMIRRNR